jgi:hypothetical protein
MAVYPDFLNLGLAPAAPRGALGVAPRAALRPIGMTSIGPAYTRMVRGFEPQLLMGYLLPFQLAYPGPAFQANYLTGLIPNPYTGT